MACSLNYNSSGFIYRPNLFTPLPVIKCFKMCNYGPQAFDLLSSETSYTNYVCPLWKCPAYFCTLLFSKVTNIPLFVIRQACLIARYWSFFFFFTNIKFWDNLCDRLINTQGMYKFPCNAIPSKDLSRYLCIYLLRHATLGVPGFSSEKHTDKTDIEMFIFKQL